MSGSASVTGGTISSVAWSNNRGGSGSATGTATWSQSGLTLYQGLNVITLTTTDELSLQTTYTINVTADIQRTWIRH